MSNFHVLSYKFLMILYQIHFGCQKTIVYAVAVHPVDRFQWYFPFILTPILSKSTCLIPSAHAGDPSPRTYLELLTTFALTCWDYRRECTCGSKGPRRGDPATEIPSRCRSVATPANSDLRETSSRFGRWGAGMTSTYCGEGRAASHRTCMNLK